jgi:DNA replication protein DnaC
MLTEQTRERLYAMKLHGMATAYEEQNLQVRSGELSFDERLAMLVDRQWTWREDRALQGRLRQAKFKVGACVEDLDLRTPRGLTRAQLDQLATSQWVRYHQNVLITGPTGTGKTYLACALGQKACRDGYRVRYFVAAKLFRLMAAGHADGSYMRLLEQLQKTALLIIDDWGMETLTDAQYRDLLETLDDRHGSGATLITSQFPVSVWHDTIGNPTVADAILDRLLPNAHQIELRGGSLRARRTEGPPSARGEEEA